MSTFSLELTQILVMALPLLLAYLLDTLVGDPEWLPHPIVFFGKLIAWGERMLNKGKRRMLRGGLLSVSLIAGTFLLLSLFFASYFVGILFLEPVLGSEILLFLLFTFEGLGIFYCLAGTTLIKEVRMVFDALDRSLADGRKQLSRIVGRDTSSLSHEEVQRAALETLSENLSDGVVAPLFYYALLGLPGMMMYKMVNTLDSMIGYKNERYLYFGRVAAYIDDFFNYIPARLTAILMLIAVGKPQLLRQVFREGCKHSSPNAGYPEAALALILGCRFGGPNSYFGKVVDKPYIGTSDKDLKADDLSKALGINKRVGLLMLLLTLSCAAIHLIYLELFYSFFLCL